MQSVEPYPSTKGVSFPFISAVRSTPTTRESRLPRVTAGIVVKGSGLPALRTPTTTHFGCDFEVKLTVTASAALPTLLPQPARRIAIAPLTTNRTSPIVPQALPRHTRWCGPL